MVVSSGSSPMAYVLSNIRTNTFCGAQLLINFDPINFSIFARWAK